MMAAGKKVKNEKQQLGEFIKKEQKRWMYSTSN